MLRRSAEGHFRTSQAATPHGLCQETPKPLLAHVVIPLGRRQSEQFSVAKLLAPGVRVRQLVELREGHQARRGCCHNGTPSHDYTRASFVLPGSYGFTGFTAGLRAPTVGQISTLAILFNAA